MRPSFSQLNETSRVPNCLCEPATKINDFFQPFVIREGSDLHKHFFLSVLRKRNVLFWRPPKKKVAKTSLCLAKEFSSLREIF